MLGMVLQVDHILVLLVDLLLVDLVLLGMVLQVDHILVLLVDLFEMLGMLRADVEAVHAHGRRPARSSPLR